MHDRGQGQLLMEGKAVYGAITIPYRVQFRARKTLAVEVHPDLSVHVVAPIGTSERVIEELVTKRGGWIGKQRRYFEQFLPHHPPRLAVAGETWTYMGRRYLLRIESGKEASVKLTRGELRVVVPDRKEQAQVKRLLAAWYHEHARAKFNEQVLLAVDELRLHHLIRVPKLAYRTMKRRWGSCSPSGTLTLNPDLIQAPVMCIRYVILHELCHLVYMDHGKEFQRLLGRVMPDYRRWKERLEAR